MTMTTSQDTAGPTLTNVNYFGRLTIKYGVLVLVTLMVGRVALGAFITYWRATHPPPPPPPTVGFGVLPAPIFPSESEARPAKYKLETPTGGTPEFGDRAKVFLMPVAASSLLSDEQAKNIAKAYGFTSDPEVLDSRTYRWNRSEPLITTFELDIRNHTFSYTTNYQSHPELLLNVNLPSSFDAVQRVKSFLSTAQLLPSDIATASGEITPLKSLGGELTEAASISDAEFVQVDIFRGPVDQEMQMYSPEGYRGTVSAVISGSLTGQSAVVAMDFYHHQVDYDQVHTYPIKTAKEAWQLLQAGQGYVVDPGEADEAVVRSIKLGYYDSFEEQSYLQPIYVFEGDGGFLGYVPAVDSRYLQ